MTLSREQTMALVRDAEKFERICFVNCGLPHDECACCIGIAARDRLHSSAPALAASHLAALDEVERRDKAVQVAIFGYDYAEINALRLLAFQTNAEADKQRYFGALSKWFQNVEGNYLAELAELGRAALEDRT